MNKLRRVLCALFDHPRVVSMFFGQIACGRCGAVVGDSLSGADQVGARVQINHSAGCEKCADALASLKWHERILTRLSA